MKLPKTRFLLLIIPTSPVFMILNFKVNKFVSNTAGHVTVSHFCSYLKIRSATVSMNRNRTVPYETAKKSYSIYKHSDFNYFHETDFKFGRTVFTTAGRVTKLSFKNASKKQAT